MVSNGRLQLRFRYAGKRHYVLLGLPDSKTNRKADERDRIIDTFLSNAGCSKYSRVQHSHYYPLVFLIKPAIRLLPWPWKMGWMLRMWGG
ncbi:MAG: DUF3596 domain-containing protein [Cyanothece sp. SIO2G6]|nr:DUF3596 domain-containing protein [Cyanothece sp. SIO2G6]